MASLLERANVELNYWAAVANEQKLRIEMLEDALVECRCAMQDIRDDGWLIKAIETADKVLEAGEEAQA